MNLAASIVLKKDREHSIKRFHPWVFSGAIHAMEGNPSQGDWVEVKDFNKKTLGYGHYQKGTITVRLLSFPLKSQRQKSIIQKLRRPINYDWTRGSSHSKQIAIG